MNQNQILQLTSHLSQALDQNYDVVNMEAVLSVICALEGTTITKEQLEATRLAKYINQLRRRTTNEHLARRAKSLLKKWREMVGIQQTTNDSQPPQPQLQPVFKSTIGGSNTTDQSTAETTAKAQYSQPASPMKFEKGSGTGTTEGTASNLLATKTAANDWNAIKNSNLNTQNRITMPDLPDTNIYLAESTSVGVQQQQHTNFSNLINNAYHEENSVSKPTKSHRELQNPSSVSLINEHSNSVSNFPPGNEKSNETSIIIDIVSDSDDYDAANQVRAKTATLPCPPAPAAACSKPKKLKKDKKRKEKDGGRTKSANIHEPLLQQSRNVKHNVPARDLMSVRKEKNQTNAPAVSEILSLSNSSMSSMLSGDTAAGSSMMNIRTTPGNLSFAGRFKSVSQLDNFNYGNVAVANGQKSGFRPTADSENINQSTDFIITNDTSTSGSRLSPFEEIYSKQNRSQPNMSEDVDVSSIQVPVNVPPISKGVDAKKMDYAENVIVQTPKKRGRKKGSKGVDSVIAKESSLSQQIFLGSGFKKVKTTKELFNEIQNRKLNTSNRNETVSLPNKGDRKTPSHSLLSRPASSCSDTSMNSPHTFDHYSANDTLMGKEFTRKIGDTGNTDSDTITSEPSHDSLKSRAIKRSTSLDSNSNSMPTSSAKATETSTPANADDVNSQLRLLIHSLNSPLSINEAERSYQAQIVPCTCIILEELPKLSAGQSCVSLVNIDTNDQNIQSQSDATLHFEKQDVQSSKKEGTVVDEVAPTNPQKQIKSIFDLDFDDDDDPLHSIMNDITPPNTILKPGKKSANDSKIATINSKSNDDNNIDLRRFGGSGDEQKNTDEAMQEPQPIFTVQEDPNCVAMQRFNVQTNEITSFHINALHNYYVPNINGNWDAIGTSDVVKTTISAFLKTYYSYTVTDGADVVPKFGALTYERIQKDLSGLSFSADYKKKRFQKITTPFLGVAKCLQSCRKTKQLNNASKSKSGLLPNQMEESKKTDQSTNYCEMLEGPLSVEVEVLNDDKVEMQYLNELSNTHFSNNLLRMATNDLDEKPSVLSEEAGDNSNEHSFVESVYRKENNSRPSSSCSDSSTIKNPHSVHAKLLTQHQQTQMTQQERHFLGRKRKKRRKTELEAGSSELDECNARAPILRIKRIKIAFNGNVATQRQISSSNNSSDDENVETLSELSDIVKTKDQTASEDELESSRSHSTTIESIAADEEDSNNEEEYAIVQKPMDAGKHHLVLTIKKTPSKLNSPANSISTVSPIVIDTAEQKEHSNINETNINGVETVPLNLQRNHEHNFLEVRKEEVNESNTNTQITMSATCVTSFNRHNRPRRRRKINYKKQQFDADSKHLFNRDSGKEKTHRKPHHKLFFRDELCRHDRAGRKERIINYSSSSSNYGDESDSEYSSEDTKTIAAIDSCNKNEFKIETDTRPSAFKAGLNYDSRQGGPHPSITHDKDSNEEFGSHSSSDNEFADIDGADKLNFHKSELPLYNNGMLPSFNSIYANCPPSQSASEGGLKRAQSLESLHNNNCDDVNLCYNNNNLNLIEYNLERRLISNDNRKDVANNCSEHVLNNVNSDQRLNDIDSKVLLLPSLEYRTGMRALGEEKLSSEQTSNTNTSRIQQFKEWHQVLQLKSYNNEPLIVLPYVVLE